jgi:hypothetical protein
MTAVVTDTEATMVAAGRLFVERSQQVNGDTRWYGFLPFPYQLLYSGLGEAAFKAETWEGCEANTRCCNEVVEHILTLLEDEGDHDCNLNDQQWLIITNVKVISSALYDCPEIIGRTVLHYS